MIKPAKSNRWFPVVILAAALASGAGCGSPKPSEVAGPPAEVPPEVARVAVGPLLAGLRFGQTFLCPANGLNRIEVLAATYTKKIPSGTILLRLFTGVGEGTEIAAIPIPASQVVDNTNIAMEFSPIADSRGKTYFLSVEAQDIPAGYAFTLYRSATDVYAGGRFYLDSTPQDQDLCFRTSYATPPK